MEGIPIVVGIVIFACGFFAGFFWGTRFGRTSESTRFVGEAAPSNFTPRAQQVLALAHKEAESLNHNFVGTEHLFLGLIKLDPSVQSVAVNVLRKMGLDFEKVQMEIERFAGTDPDQKMVRIGSDEKMTGNIPYTPRVKRTLMLAAKEAKALKHTYVGTEHILLGLLREDGVVPRVLKNMDIDVEQIRVEILKELDPNLRGGRRRRLE
jgi:ATP-dependent Clp protease ATP-binding subunit ClpC